MAVIGINKKNKYIGIFDDEILAAEHYDFYALYYNKDFASLNFPNKIDYYKKIIPEHDFINRKKRGRSKYNGVYYEKSNNNWKVVIRVNNKNKHISCHQTEIEAAKAYDRFVINNNLNKKLNFNQENKNNGDV